MDFPLGGGCSVPVHHLSLPFTEFTGDSEAAIAPGSQPSPLPASAQYCAMEQAQASYHGHRDAVRFLICVPGMFGFHPGWGDREEWGLVR